MNSLSLVPPGNLRYMFINVCETEFNYTSKSLHLLVSKKMEKRIPKALPHLLLEPKHTSKTNLLIQQHHHGAGVTLLHFKIL